LSLLGSKILKTRLNPPFLRTLWLKFRLKNGLNARLWADLSSEKERNPPENIIKNISMLSRRCALLKFHLCTRCRNEFAEFSFTSAYIRSLSRSHFYFLPELGAFFLFHLFFTSRGLSTSRTAAPERSPEVFELHLFSYVPVLVGWKAASLFFIRPAFLQRPHRHYVKRLEQDYKMYN